MQPQMAANTTARVEGPGPLIGSHQAFTGSQGTLLEGPGSQKPPYTNFKFKPPFSMIVAAPSGFGKTYMTKKILEQADQTIDPPPQRIIWCFSQNQPMYQDMLRTIPGIEFIRGIPPNLEDDSFLDVNIRNLIVLDDLMSDIGKDQRITDLYTKGSHHRNLSVITLMQNFYEPKTVSIRRNAQYLMLFNMPGDQQQVKTMSQRMFPHKPNYMLEEYKRATSKPYGYLLVDLKPDTLEHDRLKTNILPTDTDIPPQQIWNQPAMQTEERTEKYKYKPDTPRYQPLETATADKTPRFDAPGIRPTEVETEEFIITPDMVSCNYCGIVFANLDELQHHLAKWCFETRGQKRHRVDDSDDDDITPKQTKVNWVSWSDQEDDNSDQEDGDSTSDNDDDNSVFDPLILEVYDDMQADNKAKVESYKSEGMSLNAAKNRAYEDLIPRFAKATRNKYARWCQLLRDLDKNKIHNTIKKTIDDLMDEEDMGWREAMQMALKKRKFLFEELLENCREKEEE